MPKQNGTEIKQNLECKEFATQYTISLNGVRIGTVSKLFQDWRSRRPPTWQFDAINGGRGQVSSREHAIRSLVYLAQGK